MPVTRLHFSLVKIFSQRVRLIMLPDFQNLAAFRLVLYYFAS